MDSEKMITITKVVSRNIIMDFVAKFQNMVGMNLTIYEDMVNKGMSQLSEELNRRQIIFKWYHLQITQLTNGAISITIYGEQQ